MFIQVITGHKTDADRVERQRDKWEREIRPGATGFLGSTGGVTAEGRLIVIARFESEAAARANSERAEQGEWWAAMDKLIDGAEFHDSTDQILLLGGGNDNAGFVQVMRGHITDAAKLATLREGLARMETVFSAARPDVIGEMIALHPDGTYTDAVYFSSEAEARANETKPMPDEAQQLFGELMSAVAIDEYLDLTDPWFQ
jgi:hypothetical protein